MNFRGSRNKNMEVAVADPGLMDKMVKLESSEIKVEPEEKLEEDRILEDLSIRVFGNDMLREMILSKVVLPSSPGEKLSRVDMRSIRGVQKSWRSTVSQLVRRRREALLQLSLNKDNSRSNSAHGRENGKLLAEFNRIMAEYEDEQIPTFSLKLDPDFFRQENHSDFKECFVRNGSEMISLDLEFPLSSSMIFVFPPFNLPKLQRLSVHFCDCRMLAGGGDSSVQTANNNSTIYFLQTLMNQTVELDEFHLKHCANLHSIPQGFECLYLPETITKLLLDSPMTNKTLSMLTKSDLPGLIQLRLMSSVTAYDTEIMYEVLNNFRSHLKTLNLRGGCHFLTNGGPPVHQRRPTTMVRLPVMEALEIITVTSNVWQLEGEDDEIRWDKNLPVLKELRLLHQTGSTLRKWTNTHATALPVKRLFVSLVNQNNNIQGLGHHMPASITVEHMQGIHLTLPNITCLEITLCGPQTCALRYLFMEMTSLHKLAISIKTGAEFPPGINWDSLLLGVPSDVVTSFLKNPGFWSSVELKDDSYPSIRKLTELKSLALVESSYGPGIQANEPGLSHSLISDLSFHFGFLKMENLKYLLLSGRFQASPTMCEKWKKQKGMSIVCIKRSI